MNFYHIHSTHDSPQSVSQSWLDNALGRIICPSCYTPVKNEACLDLVIDGDMQDVALNIASSVAIGIIRLDLLSAFDESLFRQNFFLGSITNAKGQVREDFFTFRGKGQLLIRGGVDSTHRICSSCNRLLYHPIGKRYVVQSTLKEAVPLYESQFHQIIGNAETYQRIASMASKKLKLTSLPVMAKASDNLTLH